jgi:hypothetical protein
MTDSELQNILLREHYDRRKEDRIAKWHSIEDQEEAKRIFLQLMDKELVYGYKMEPEDGSVFIYDPKITAKGIDMIENPKQESTHHTQHINIHGGENFQIGNNNSMNVNNISSQIQILFDAIDRKDAPPEKKEEAKSWIRRTMDNPLFNTILGATLGKIDNTSIDQVTTIFKTLMG